MAEIKQLIKAEIIEAEELIAEVFTPEAKKYFRDKIFFYTMILLKIEEQEKDGKQEMVD